ncbi:hypothetical protein QFC24_006670 [Naganishia onofrii]|uniref:Uncharacterized protein n=1 Tax=Naganishia onofrii TaxID=1851511 RepID=A0ACC2X041_9TREE|nr:hypothetical protein QFC24_006670 [Naganishia onofrii]
MENQSERTPSDEGQLWNDFSNIAAVLYAELQALKPDLEHSKYGVVVPPSGVRDRLRMFQSRNDRKALNIEIQNIWLQLNKFCKAAQEENGSFADLRAYIKPVAQQIKRCASRHTDISDGLKMFRTFQEVLWLMAPIYLPYCDQIVPRVLASHNKCAFSQTRDSQSGPTGAGMTQAEAQVQIRVNQKLWNLRNGLAEKLSEYLKRNETQKIAYTSATLEVVFARPGYDDYFFIQEARCIAQMQELRRLSRDPYTERSLKSLIDKRLVPFSEAVNKAEVLNAGNDVPSSHYQRSTLAAPPSGPAELRVGTDYSNSAQPADSSRFPELIGNYRYATSTAHENPSGIGPSSLFGPFFPQEQPQWERSANPSVASAGGLRTKGRRVLLEYKYSYEMATSYSHRYSYSYSVLTHEYEYSTQYSFTQMNIYDTYQTPLEKSVRLSVVYTAIHTVKGS